jgi:ribosomal protein S18 acetylase RimI-like enzyme
VLTFEIRRATDPAEIIAAEEHFDNPARVEWAEKFLATQGHHLLVAYVDDVPAGFVSGVETVHPDKGTEMFLYELAVGEKYRRNGIARALVNALGKVAKETGCYGMWVAVDPDNDAALATYRSAGSPERDEAVVLVWDFPPR